MPNEQQAAVGMGMHSLSFVWCDFGAHASGNFPEASKKA